MNDNSQEFNQRTMRAVIVCLLVVFAYTNIFLAPKKSPQAPQPSQQAPQVANVEKVVAPAPAAPRPSGPVAIVGAPQKTSDAHPTPAEVTSSGVTFVESDLTKIAISHLGARLQSYALSNYKVLQGEEALLDLVGDIHDAPLPLGVYVGSESDERVVYKLVSVNGVGATTPTANLRIVTGGRVELEFKGALPSGLPITKKIILSDGSYLFSVEVALGGAAQAGESVWLEWPHRFAQPTSSRSTGLSHVTYIDGFNKVHHLPEGELSGGLRDFGTSRWVALGDLYFMSTLIPSVSGRNTMIGRDGELYTGRVAGTQSGGSFTVYAGPKDYKTLEFIGDYQLQRSIDLGWFSFLALPLLWLLHYLYVILNNYGLAIIVLTLIVKTVLLPLSQASFKSMKAMQEIQPEMKALRERVKDPNQLNQEIFALYKRRGVNPMGGCLPMFIQIPVFFGLYQALLNSIELRHSPFALWITDLSSPERLELFGIGVPVMVLLMAASMIIQQWTTPNPSADPAQQKVMMIMPFVFAGMFIIFPMPSGLVLYWLVNNVISITQQMYLRANKGSVYFGTVVASAAIFAVGFILTLI